MPNLDFYFTTQEVREILEILLERNYKFLMSKDYIKPIHEVIDSAEKLRGYGNENKLVYIMHEEYTNTLVPFYSFVRDGKTLYYLSQGEGGPTIDLYWPGNLYNQPGLINCSGFLNLSTYYYVNNEKIAIGDNEKNHFQMIRKAIINRAKSSFVLAKRKYWVSGQVMNQLKEGATLDINSKSELTNVMNQLEANAKP